MLVQYLMTLAGDAACASPNSTNYPRGLSLDRASFAGWNTDGNTLGDAIANAIVLHYFADYGAGDGARAGALGAALRTVAQLQRDAAYGTGAVSPASGPVSPSTDPVAPCRASCANTYRQLLRVVEDSNWQATFRQFQDAYIAQVDGENDYTLGYDLAFYTHFAWKVLASRATEVAAAFALPWNLTTVYYPWNRTFEVGLFANLSGTTATSRLPTPPTPVQQLARALHLPHFATVN